MVKVNNTVFWDMTPCSLVNNYMHIKIDYIAFYKIIMLTFYRIYVYRARISIIFTALFGKRKVKQWSLIFEFP